MQLDSPFNLFPALLAQTAATTSAAGLSEAELLAKYPGIALVASVLFGLGILCDLYLITRYTRRSSTPDSGQTPLFQVTPKPWGIQELLILVALFFGVFAIGNSVAALVMKLAHINEEHAIPGLLLLEVAMRLIIFAGFIVFLRIKGIDWTHAFGLGRRSVQSIWLGLIFYLAVLPPLGFVFAAYAKFCQLIGIDATPQPVADLLTTTDSRFVVVAVVVLALVIAPVFEEIFFRGFAYPALKQRWGTWKALSFVSLFFALVHLHIPSVGPLFALALGLGLAYELTGTLLAPITMHALFNATNIAMLLYVRTQQ